MLFSKGDAKSSPSTGSIDFSSSDRGESLSASPSLCCTSRETLAGRNELRGEPDSVTCLVELSNGGAFGNGCDGAIGGTVGEFSELFALESAPLLSAFGGCPLLLHLLSALRSGKGRVPGRVVFDAVGPAGADGTVGVEGTGNPPSGTTFACCRCDARVTDGLNTPWRAAVPTAEMPAAGLVVLLDRNEHRWETCASSTCPLGCAECAFIPRGSSNVPFAAPAPFPEDLLALLGFTRPCDSIGGSVLLPTSTRNACSSEIEQIQSSLWMTQFNVA